MEAVLRPVAGSTQDTMNSRAQQIGTVVPEEVEIYRDDEYLIPGTRPKNALLVRPAVGKVKASTYNLPGEGHRYGKAQFRDAEGAKEGAYLSVCVDSRLLLKRHYSGQQLEHASAPPCAEEQGFPSHQQTATRWRWKGRRNTQSSSRDETAYPRHPHSGRRLRQSQVAGDGCPRKS